MASVRIVLLKQKGKDGNNALALQVLCNREKKIITLFRIHASKWDVKNQKVRSSHSNSVDLNNIILERIRPIQDRINELDRSNRFYRLRDIFDYNKSGSLSEAIRRYKEKMDSEIKPQSSRKYLNLKRHVEKYGDILLSEVDKSFFVKFSKYLIDQDRINSEQTVGRYLKFLKSVLRANKIDVDYKIIIPPTIKPKLTKEEVLILANKELRGFEDLARDVFMTCLYTRGSRVGDVLMLKKSNSERFIFSQQKDSRHKTVKIKDKLSAILGKYEDEFYALPVLTLPPTDPKIDAVYYRHIQTKTTIINRNLKVVAARCGFDINLTTHVARHTYASLADKSGLSTAEISDLLGHSSIRTTEIYLRELRSDEVLDRLDDKLDL